MHYIIGSHKMIDSSVANSSGYFKDPVTKEDFSVDTPRVVECKLENGKFTWPMVMTSAGDPVKIVYKYFTDEEKNLYKAYRGRPSTGTTVRKPVEKRIPVTEEEEEDDDDSDDEYTPTPNVIHEEVKYKPGNAMAKTTEELLNKCDTFLGCSFLAGITYAVFSIKGSKQQYHIPRSLIPDSFMNKFLEVN